MSLANNYDRPLSYFHGNPVPKGEIGLEIEVEGRNLPGVMNREGAVPGQLTEYWRATADGSLRNLNEDDQSIEYVLVRPLSREDFQKALAFFSGKWQETNAEAYNSYRTSVHVHLNVSNWPIRRVWSFLTAYFILEEVLVQFADGGTKTRLGNRFCLRASDSDAITDNLAKIGRQGFTGLNLNTRDLKYGAVNIAAMVTYGSLEFRSLRGTVDTRLIQTWVDLLLSVKDYAEKFDDPTEIVRQFSDLTPRVWGERVLGVAKYQMLAEMQPNIDQLLVFGVRQAQDVAYCTPEWKPYVPFRSPVKEAVEGDARFRIHITTITNYGVRI